MRHVWAAAAVMAASIFLFSTLHLSAAGANAAGSVQKPVLELFTSQGCSSCPPADALLQRYIKRGDVIALSVAVDYWDRLGWKDSFGSAENSRRQRDYADGRGDSEVYTPQMVINGRAHAVGSRAGAINRALDLTGSDYQTSRVAISVKFDRDTFVVHLGKAKNSRNANSGNVVIAMVQDVGRVDIKRGENSGRQISYHNIVRKFQQIGTWDGQAKTLRIPRNELQSSCCQSVVVLLQDSRRGSIFSAAQVRLP